MNRSDYSDEGSNWELICWRGAVNSAIKGKRGQTFLSEMAVALDAMPIKRLIANELVSENGEVCALGAVAQYKSLKVDDADPGDYDAVKVIFNISAALAREIAYINDDYLVTPEKRWERVRQWVRDNLAKKEIPMEGRQK